MVVVVVVVGEEEARVPVSLCASIILVVLFSYTLLISISFILIAESYIYRYILPHRNCKI